MLPSKPTLEEERWDGARGSAGSAALLHTEMRSAVSVPVGRRSGHRLAEAFADLVGIFVLHMGRHRKQVARPGFYKRERDFNLGMPCLEALDARARFLGALSRSQHARYWLEYDDKICPVPLRLVRGMPQKPFRHRSFARARTGRSSPSNLAFGRWDMNASVRFRHPAAGLPKHFHELEIVHVVQQRPTPGRKLVRIERKVRHLAAKSHRGQMQEAPRAEKFVMKVAAKDLEVGVSP